MTAIDIPGYVIRREVGVGGMASVYLALQTSLDREVALKIMSPALAADPTFSKRFLQEARMLASLAHPNIVQVYDVGVTQSQVNYFSMQYLANGDFAQRVRLGWSKDLLRVLEESQTRWVTRICVAMCIATWRQGTSCSMPVTHRSSRISALPVPSARPRASPVREFPSAPAIT